MENVIYNELLRLGYGVDVGTIRSQQFSSQAPNASSQLEVDFVAEKGDARYYIQSAYSVESDEKMFQEKRPLLAVRDSFRKILIEGDDFEAYQDENGIVHVGIVDFLLDASCVLK